MLAETGDATVQLAFWAGLEWGVWKELLPAGLNQEVSALTLGGVEDEKPLIPASGEQAKHTRAGFSLLPHPLGQLQLKTH